MFTLPVRGLVEVTVAVSVKVPPAAILALDVVSVMDVGTGPPPPPPPPLYPPPQPSTKVKMNAAPEITMAFGLRRCSGVRRRSSNANPLAKLPLHQSQVPGKIDACIAWVIAAVAPGPPLGAVVVNVMITGTGDPFKLAIDGLKLRVMPGGRNGPALSVTGLGTLDRGVTFTVAACDWPAVTVIVVFGKVKSGMFTVMKLEPAFEPA